jgi:transcriptional regulator with XRE-family HTH domain
MKLIVASIQSRIGRGNQAIFDKMETVKGEYSMSKDISKRLIQLRTSHYLSIEEYAKKINVSIEEVKQWESGTSKPNSDHLIALAKLYECSIDDLLTCPNDTHFNGNLHINSSGIEISYNDKNIQINDEGVVINSPNNDLELTKNGIFKNGQLVKKINISFEYDEKNK